MFKRILTLAVVATLAWGAQAKVKLSHLVGDNMVIQQQTDVRLWGWAKPNSTVTATTSWSQQKSTAKAGKDGQFLLTVKSPKASYTPLSITFDDGEGAVTINNVLAGEVWVCAGQSNMEMPVKGFGMCPVKGYNHHVLDAINSKGVRSIKIPSVMSSKPLNDAQAEWRVCSPKTVGEFSATGYFFARLLSRTLDIPVGIIEANKGGSRVESWLTKENLEKYTNDPTDSVAICKKWAQWDYHRSLLWGNGTFNPILKATVKGIIYYQGCSNVGDPGDQYSQRMKLLVEQWRSQFGLGEIPFYFVEIAPYVYGDGIDGVSGAKLREQQFKASQIIPNSSLVSTNDLVYPNEINQIHPTQKQPVGERLAFTALNRDYGFDSWFLALLSTVSRNFFLASSFSPSLAFSNICFTSMLTTAALSGMNLAFFEDFAHDESTKTAMSSKYIRLVFLCFITFMFKGLKIGINSICWQRYKNKVKSS